MDEITSVGRQPNAGGVECHVSSSDGAAEVASGTAGLHSEISILMCRCSMIHEDSLEVYDNDGDDADVTTIDQSHSDSELADESSPVDTERGFGNTLEVPMASHNPPTVGSRPLVSVRSSPQLLNEICEETETADDEDVAGSAAVTSQTHVSRRSSTEQSRHLDRLHRVHRRKMATMVPRVASCSSSDTSDTDDIVDQNGRKQRKQKPSATLPANVKFLSRRDSSEHSSDNDSQPCGSANYPCSSNFGSGVYGSGTTRRSSDSQCGNRQGQGRESGRTKRAESEHSYLRHALKLCRSTGRCHSAVITDWKSLESRLVFEVLSDCYPEEAEDEFCSYSTQLDRDAIMNAHNQLSSIFRLHSDDCVTDSIDVSVIMKWCTNDGGLPIDEHSLTGSRVNSNSVAVLTGMGCADPYESRLRARKVSL